MAGARVLVDESVALFRHTEDKPALMSQLLNLAHVEVTSGEAASGRRHLEEALSLISSLGAMPWEASWVRLRLAHLVAEGGDPWRARDLLNRALRCFEGAWDPRGLAACRRLLERLDAMTATS